ncbi:MAG TPA: hypothetical protein PKA63_00865 [Oligoflexia bacterium]|nr:hypothetical protein [Oligoflexia bacterium]HMP47201.1 hypothetical protein [Oligoflexia bacterium]
MNRTMQVLSAAALAGLISGASSTPASADMGISIKGGATNCSSCELSEKESCKGKDSCSGKDECSSKDGDKGDKESCGGKDSCGGKE